MNAIAQALVDGLMVLEETVGATITWAGETYPCTGGGQLGGKMLGMGGYRITAQSSIAVRTALFEGAKPKEKQTLIYTSAEDADPQTLRITNINSFHGAFMILECDDLQQGA